MTRRPQRRTPTRDARPARGAPTARARLLAWLALAALHPFAPATLHAQHAHSPYTGHQDREIKALAPATVEALLRGDGMELALAAELNGYAGPKHALELATPLGLSPDQREAVRRVHRAMQEAATRIGAEIVALERTLDTEFRRRSIDAERLEALTARIATLQGRLRATHLAAHLALDRILTPEQQARYAELRGYTAR